MNELRIRVITGIVLAAVLGLILIMADGQLGGLLWRLVVLSLALLGAWEWGRLLGDTKWSRVGFGIGLMVICLMVLIALGGPLQGTMEEAQKIVAALWSVMLIRLAVGGSSTRADFALLMAMGLMAIPVAALVVMNLPVRWVVSLLVLVISGDIAAFFVGRRYGTTRLSPEISPGKTRAGLWGALLAAAVLGAPLGWWLELPATAIPVFGLLALVTVCFGGVGDLTASLLKRQARVKDSGRLFPGHGGVLDRIDSMLGAAPIFAVGYAVLMRAIS